MALQKRMDKLTLSPGQKSPFPEGNPEAFCWCEGGDATGEFEDLPGYEDETARIIANRQREIEETRRAIEEGRISFGFENKVPDPSP